MGALMLVLHGELFDRVALIEGGTEGWTLKRSQTYDQGGGSRVLFVCGTESCRRDAEEAGRTLELTGLGARVLFAEGAGHTEGGRVRELVSREIEWLLSREGPRMPNQPPNADRKEN
jgi:hypothetical protein